MEQTKIDPTDTHNARKTQKSTKSLRAAKFKINDASFGKKGSRMNEAIKKMNKIWDISMKDTKIRNIDDPLVEIIRSANNRFQNVRDFAEK